MYPHDYEITNKVTIILRWVDGNRRNNHYDIRVDLYSNGSDKVGVLHETTASSVCGAIGRGG